MFTLFDDLSAHLKKVKYHKFVKLDFDLLQQIA